ncbi:MAG: LysE family translocator [Fuerstiella sp.]|nr:LysE family translocator [Fuerstiella sp.]MCP4858640.1 LysE family translocator [Fuerstiella sp.]
MFESSSLILFVTATALLVIVPGPNSLFVIARSVEQGRRIGLVSCVGVLIGTLVHVIAAALGLSALLVSSALAFNILKYAGAIYLVWLGIRTLIREDKIDQHIDNKEQNTFRILIQGTVVNVLNPKSALFFLAFLPQFVDASRGAVGMQVLVLGMIVACLGTTADVVYATISGSFGNAFRHNLKVLRTQRYLVGSVYIGLGLVTAFSGVKQKA